MLASMGVFLDGIHGTPLIFHPSNRIKVAVHPPVVDPVVDLNYRCNRCNRCSSKKID
jgi:hypothetical protein